MHTVTTSRLLLRSLDSEIVGRECLIQAVSLLAVVLLLLLAGVEGRGVFVPLLGRGASGYVFLIKLCV